MGCGPHRFLTVWAAHIFGPHGIFNVELETPSYQAKVSHLCSKKLSASGDFAPDPLNKGSATMTLLAEQPPDLQQWRQSIAVHGVRTPQFVAVSCQNMMYKCAESFSFWETSSPRDPTRALPLDHTG